MAYESSTGRKTSATSPTSLSGVIDSRAREQARQMVRKPNPTVTIGPDPLKKFPRPSCVLFKVTRSETIISTSLAYAPLRPADIDGVVTDIQNVDGLPLPWWDEALLTLMVPVGTWEVMTQVQFYLDDFTVPGDTARVVCHTKNQQDHTGGIVINSSGSIGYGNTSGSTYGIPQNWLTAAELGDIRFSVIGDLTCTSWSMDVTVVRLSEKQWIASEGES